MSAAGLSPTSPETPQTPKDLETSQPRQTPQPPQTSETSQAPETTEAHPSVWVLPSHRITDRDIAQLREAVLRARGRHDGPGPFVVGVDGRSGAGKSELALRLQRSLAAADHSGSPERITLFRLEDLYPGWDGLAQGVELWAGMMDRLLQGQDAAWHAWDWHAGAPEARRQTVSAQSGIVIVEGVGATAPGHPSCAPHFGVWLHLEAAERRRRALRRDGEMYRPHWERWAAQEDRLFSA